jgi:hypothetical protein
MLNDIGRQLLFVVLFSLTCCCIGQTQTLKFLFTGHTYDWGASGGTKVDSRIEKLDLKSYDGIWLGGDICANTSLDPKTWNYLDNIFNLKNPWTHVALGNHDYRDDNLHLYYSAKGKPDFYTSNIQSMVFSVINTNLNASNCELLDKQFEMLETVTDTIEDASHYILLMHHQIFDNIPGLSDFTSNGVCSNYQITCTGKERNFDERLYPKLVDLQNKGIQVVLLVGDTGWHKGGHWQCEAGIDFIASGINNSYYRSKAPEQLNRIERDKIVEFEFDVKLKKLNWQFVELCLWK